MGKIGEILKEMIRVSSLSPEEKKALVHKIRTDPSPLPPKAAEKESRGDEYRLGVTDRVEDIIQKERSQGRTIGWSSAAEMLFEGRAREVINTGAAIEHLDPLARTIKDLEKERIK